MNRRILLACIVLFTAVGAASANADERPKLSCDRGGDVARYGGTDWTIFGCSDGKTLAFVTAQGNPATPFFFMLTPKDGEYQLYGEGTGDKKVTDAAYADLKALTPAQIAALLASHGAAANP